ncbi:putative reverse transcriptase domain-containing protein [Tanacetum coccineum]
MATFTEALIAEFASAPTPPSPPLSPLSPLSSPLPRIPSPSTHTSPTYAEAPLGYRAAMIWSRVASPPPRARFSALASRFEVGESMTDVVARQARYALTSSVDYGFIDIVDASIRAFESRAMTTLGEVNERVTDLAITQRQDAHELHMRDEDEQDDLALLRTQAVIARQAWSCSEDRSMTLEASIRTLEAQVRTLQTRHDRMKWQRQDAAHRISGNGDDSHESGSGRRIERAASECTYSDFLKCQPLNFKGTEGVVSLTQWFEKMESVFHIGNCNVACQIKFAIYTLLGNALTWWNSHVKTVGHEVAYGMTWKTLKKMMTDKYCPRGEIKKLKIELWNLKVKGTDVLSYNQRFQELALMYGRMFLKESNEVEKYVGGLPDMIQGSVMASKPKTMQDVIEFATELMDQKICTLADRQAENKRKIDDNSRNNQNQQHLFKRQNVARAYTTRPGRRKYIEDLNPYALNAPTILIGSVLLSAPTARGLAIWPETGYFKRDCPKLKNNNYGNHVGNCGATTMAYAVGNAGKNSDANVVTGTFLLNNRYASILLDIGVDRSFVSTAFRSLIDIAPTTLDHDYDVELADGKIIGVNTIIRGCTLNFLNHPFNIDLMPIELGCFDVNIGMDWLVKYHESIRQYRL